MSLSIATVRGKSSGVTRLCLWPEVRWSQWPPLWEELWTSKWSQSLIEFPFILMNNSEFVKGRKSNFFFIWNTQFASPRTLSPRGGRNTAPHSPHLPNHTPLHRKPLSAGDLNSFFYPAVPNSSYIAAKTASGVFIRMQLRLVSGKATSLKN